MIREYYAQSGQSKRKLSATSIAEALSMLQPGEIVVSEHRLPSEQEIRYHARLALQYKHLHRMSIARIQKRTLAGMATGKSTARALVDAQTFRRQFAEHRALLRRALERVNAVPSAECAHGAA